MHIARIGITPLKGAHHAALPSVQLTSTGPVGDRELCLVDVARGRVLRTVEHPRLVLVEARWDGTILTLRTPDGREVTDAPEATGESLTQDYWGRQARLDLLDSPHSRLLTEHLGHEVRLARVAGPGEVVYGHPVSLVCTGDLETLGEPDSARFRATITLDAPTLPPAGSDLRLGEAVVRIRDRIPRCRVIDINPATGQMDTRHLATLAARPRPVGEIPFGVDAVVVTPGTIRVGQPASVVPS